MTKGVKIIWTFAAAAIVLILMVAAYWVAERRLDEASFRKKFSSISGVSEVEEYFNHEGFRMVKLRLKDGGSVAVGNFDESIFIDTDSIKIEEIGGYDIRCQSRYEGRAVNILSAFNIVEYAETEFPHVRIRSIGDLVSNYHQIYPALKQDLFQNGGIEIVTGADDDQPNSKAIRCTGNLSRQ